MDSSKKMRVPRLVSRPMENKIIVPALSKVSMLRPKAASASPYDELLQSLYDAVLIADEDGRILDANMRTEALLGFSLDKLKSMKMAEFVEGGMEPTDEQGDDPAFYYLLERDCRSKSGAILRMEIAVSKIIWNKTQGRCYSLRDITQRKEMESALRAVYRAISNTASGIVITDRDGAITYANAAFVFMLGLQHRTEAMQMNIRQCLGDALDEILACVGDFQSCSSKGSLLRKDGSSLPVQLVCSPNLNSDGKPAGMVFCCEDITERLRMEDVTRQAQDQKIETERINARLETISTLGRELNSPLQALLSMAELDRRDDYRRQIDRIVNIVKELHGDPSLSRPASADSVASDHLHSGLRAVCAPNKLLIVDDEDAICSVFARLLKSARPDLIVETASEGKQAVVSFKQNRHNIILLDIMMPDMTGEAVFHAINDHCRANRWELPHMVFCSGFILPDNISRIVKGSGYHAVLRKPVSSKELIDTIGSFLEKTD